MIPDKKKDVDKLKANVSRKMNSLNRVNKNFSSLTDKKKKFYKMQMYSL